MEERINKTVKYLQAEYIMIWILPIVLVILYETGIMTEGDYAGDARMDYILQTIGILLTVGLIPLSLRLFSLSLVKCVKLLSLPDALSSYRRWNEIRLGLLVVPVLTNCRFTTSHSILPVSFVLPCLSLLPCFVSLPANVYGTNSTY